MVIIREGVILMKEIISNFSLEFRALAVSVLRVENELVEQQNSQNFSIEILILFN